jgi:hypothetical protein
MGRGDVQAWGEVLGLGLALLAKWAEYLAVGADRHPTLELKRQDAEAAPNPDAVLAGDREPSIYV